MKYTKSKTVKAYEQAVKSREDAIRLMDMSGTDEEFSKKRELIMNDPKCIRFGGSDAASILGVSPYKTSLELYHNRINYKPQMPTVISEDLAVFGHAMEDGIANLFPYFMEKNHGIPRENIRIENDTWMYQHPDYSFAVADLDRLVFINDLPGILEIKTCNPNNHKGRDLFQNGVAPIYYEYQVRWYMMVKNLDFAYIFVMYGSSVDQMQAILVKRDLAIERKILNTAIDFYNCCIDKIEPETDNSNAELFNKYWVQTYGKDLVADKEYNPIELPNNPKMRALVNKGISISKRISELERELKEAETVQAEVSKEFLMLAKGKPAYFTMQLDESVIRWNVSPAMKRAAFDTERFKNEHPEEYKEFMEITESFDATNAKKKYPFTKSYYFPAEVNPEKPPKISDFKAAQLKIAK